MKNILETNAIIFLNIFKNIFDIVILVCFLKCIFILKYI
jgi:hypothetical protein